MKSVASYCIPGRTYHSYTGPVLHCKLCGKTFEEIKKALLAKKPRRISTKSMYHELLMAVARKFPGETRHETALRYIREKEADYNLSAEVEARLETGSPVPPEANGEAP